MNKKLKEKFPKWCFSDKKFATVLTDDIDSLLGCMIEKYVKGNDINYFYDFDKLHAADKNNKFSLLGIDLALHKGKCWDNHVTRIHKDSHVNPQSANINSILNISGDNYFDKYCMSTAILMWSFYGLPLPKTKEGKMVLLAIDSGMKGHYDDRFKDKHTEYLKLLGFGELIDLLNTTTIKDYWQLQDKYLLNRKGKIKINENGYLETKMPLDELSNIFGLDLSLPEQQFTKSHQWKNNYGNTSNIQSKKQLGNIISFAMTGRNRFSYTK